MISLERVNSTVHPDVNVLEVLFLSEIVTIPPLPQSLSSFTEPVMSSEPDGATVGATVGAIVGAAVAELPSISDTVKLIFTLFSV